MEQTISPRRTVYGLVDRQNLPPVLRTFDFAPPDACQPVRHQTIVPQQALFLMNSPFVRVQSQILSRRTTPTPARPLHGCVDELHRLLFGRPAEPDEHRLAEEFMRAGDSAIKSGEAWEEYVQALLLSNEFAYVD